MANTNIKRQITIELQLEGSKAAKAAAGHIEKYAKSVADSVPKSFSKADAAAKKHFANIEKYALNAAKSIEESFGKINYQSAADKFQKQWKSAIADVKSELKKMATDVKASASVGKAPRGTSGGSKAAAAAAEAKAPAGRVWKGGKFVETTDAEKVAEAERRAIEKLDKQRSQAMARQMAEQEKLAKQQERLAAKALKDQEALRKKEEAEANKRVSELARWEAAHEAANRKIVDSSKAALEGALLAGKGLVYLGLVAEEDMAKVAKTMIGIEAGVNVVKGGIAVWQGFADALKAAKAATLAQAAANEILAASQAGVSASAAGGGVAGAAGGAGAAAAGRAGGSALGGAAAGAAGGAATGGMAAAGKALWGLAAPVAKLAAVGVVATESVQLLGRSVGFTSPYFESVTGALISWRKAAADAAKSTEKLTKAEEAHQRRQERNRQREAEIAGKAAMRMSMADRYEADRRMIADSDPNLTALQRGQQSRAAAVAASERAEAEREAYQRRVEDQKKLGQAFSFADQAQQFEQESRAAEMRKAAEQEIYRALQQQLEMRKQLVEQSRAAAEQAKATLEAEKERTKDKVASFGRMSSGEQARLADIAKRHSAGEELSRADIDMLERSGFGGNIVRDYYSQKGQQAGGYDVLGQLGERDAEDDAHFEYQQAQGELAKAQVMAQQATNELSEQFKELTKAAQAATAAFQALMQAQNGGTPPPPGTAAPSGEPSVAGVGLGIGNGIDAMGREFNRTVQQVIDNTKRQQTNIAASQIV